MKVFQSIQEIPACVGQEVAVSDWEDISQEQVNIFGKATKDEQWIHVDVERAKTGPYGGPVAHGFLTLSLLPRFLETALRIEDCSALINYGLNRVRFPAPVPVGTRVRARIKLLEATPLDKGGYQTAWEFTVEREGGERPVCVAEMLARIQA